MPPLHHETIGSGPDVLLVHAGVCDSRMWEPQWRALADTFRLTRCDLRGFGQSPVPEEPWVHADDLAEILDRVDARDAAVVGASFGGLVALELATRHPSRVRQLVLLSPSGGLAPDDELEAFWTEEERLIDEGDLEGAVDLNLRMWVQPDVDDATRELVRSMQRRAFELQLARPEVEPEEIDLELGAMPAAVVVTGGRDLEAFRRAGERLARDMPDVRHVHLEWAGHLPSLERPEEVNELLRDAVVRPGGGSAGFQT